MSRAAQVESQRGCGPLWVDSRRLGSLHIWPHSQRVDKGIKLSKSDDRFGMLGNLSGSFVFPKCCNDALNELEKLNFLVDGSFCFLDTKHHMRSISGSVHLRKRDAILGGVDKDSTRCNFHWLPPGFFSPKGEKIAPIGSVMNPVVASKRVKMAILRLRLS